QPEQHHEQPADADRDEGGEVRPPCRRDDAKVGPLRLLGLAARKRTGKTESEALRRANAGHYEANFSTTRITALAARGLASISSARGRRFTGRTIRTRGVAPHVHGNPGGHVQPPDTA